jgi:prolyl-tRNA synthetase
MQDGKAYKQERPILGQNFKSFDVKFANAEGKQEYVWGLGCFNKINGCFR